MKQEVQKIQEVKKMKGVIKFPFYDPEEGKFSAKLLIGEKDVETLNDLMDEMDEEVSIGEMTHEGVEYSAINVKTGFDIPVFDSEGKRINNENEYPIYDGAQIIAKINFKKYEYTQKKGRTSFTKTGITGYLMGVVILKQGTPFQQETTFDDFKDLLDEELQF